MSTPTLTNGRQTITGTAGTCVVVHEYADYYRVYAEGNAFGAAQVEGLTLDMAVKLSEKLTSRSVSWNEFNSLALAASLHEL